MVNSTEKDERLIKGIKSEERHSKIERCILNGVEVEYDTKDFVLYRNPSIKADAIKDAKTADIDFFGREYLIYVGDGKNVRNPKGNISCYNMFSNWEGTKLDLSNFNTRNVVSMSCMFKECKNLQKLDLSNFNTRSVRDMSYMFYKCENLREVNLSSFYTKFVESTMYMFGYCESLKELNLYNFKLRSIQHMRSMFSDCMNLSELVLPTFVNLENIKDMYYMFDSCYSLEKLDMSGFANLELGKKGNIIDDYMYEYWGGMFHQCKNLRYICANNDFYNVLLKLNSDYNEVSFKCCGDVKFIDKGVMYESLKNTNERVAYNFYKNTYNISDDDFINALAEVKPRSLMIDFFSEDTLIPKIQGMFGIQDGSSSLTVGEVAKMLYRSYNRIIVDRALVLYLGNQYIVNF